MFRLHFFMLFTLIFIYNYVIIKCKIKRIEVRRSDRHLYRY